MLVHSRDAFEDTLDCIKNVGYNNGVIHCYSYGIEEARAFLDLGWYIAFGGGTTYTKKSKMEDMMALLKFVPDDRILGETDAPYLAPVPFRGQTNTPVLVEHVYNFVAQARGTSAESLSALVDKNIDSLITDFDKDIAILCEHYKVKDNFTRNIEGYDMYRPSCNSGVFIISDKIKKGTVVVLTSKNNKKQGGQK